jgi:hypothetical protein
MWPSAKSKPHLVFTGLSLATQDLVNVAAWRRAVLDEARHLGTLGDLGDLRWRLVSLGVFEIHGRLVGGGLGVRRWGVGVQEAGEEDIVWLFTKSIVSLSAQPKDSP